MKNHLLGAFLCALLVSGCNKYDVSVTESADNRARIFTATFEQSATRTFVEDGTLLRWTAEDRISLFDGNTLNCQYKFDGETGENAGTFSPVDNKYGTGNALTANYSIYPYASDVKISESGVITAVLPAEQHYAENSFGLGANTMVAVTEDKDDTFLGFKNVCGYLKLQLYGDDVTVKSITLEGNENETIAGKGVITSVYGQDPIVAMSDDAIGSITLNCGEGVRLGSSAETATEFWLVVPPTGFEDGFTITVADIYGGTFEKSTSKSISIERNVIKPMAASEVEITYTTIPDNQIWYTSTDGKVVTPYSANNFGAKVVSNTYSDGKGVITFDGKVTSIGYSAFRERSSLSSVIIPGSVASVGDFAFGLCSNLQTVTIPESVTVMEGNPFYSCHKLEAFYGEGASEDNRCILMDDILIMYATNSSATEYTVPANVSAINDYAFYGTSNLADLTISDNVAIIGKGAFYGCKNLASLSLGTGLTTINGSAFCSCSSLTNVVIPDNVTLIGDHSFQNCTSLESVMIGESVKNIENAAFDGCTSLKEVFCKPIDPPSIGVNIFYDNPTDRKIYVPYTSLDTYITHWGSATYEDILFAYDFEKGERVQQNNEIWYNASSEFKLSYDQNDVKIFGASIKSSEYDSVTDEGIIRFNRIVTKIGENAFSNSSYSLSSISIPNSVTRIEASAFESCSYLDDIIIPDNVTFIGNGAFAMCTSLTAITIPDNVQTIGERAFRQCWNLTSIHIGNAVSTIGTNAFGDCSSLEHFTGKYAEDNGRCLVKDNVMIAYAAASGSTYEIPAGVTSIGPYAFEFSSLTDITIPEGVTAIGDSAFWGCSKLTSVTIPESVSVIDRWAFSSCNTLGEVYLKSMTPPSVGYSAFDKTVTGFQINVPEEAVSTYKNTKGWSDYASYIVGYDHTAY